MLSSLNVIVCRLNKAATCRMGRSLVFYNPKKPSYQHERSRYLFADVHWGPVGLGCNECALTGPLGDTPTYCNQQRTKLPSGAWFVTTLSQIVG